MLKVLTLDKAGVALAILMGILILFFGRNYGLLFLIDIAVFLVLSAIVTMFGKSRKEGIGMYETARGWKNVLCNGLVPLLLAFSYFLYSSMSVIPMGPLIAYLYIASVAAVTADKFSSEIGVLDGEPIMLVTMKYVKKGVSGGVTPLGMAAALVAAGAIGASAFLISGSLEVVAIIAISGFLGSLADSLLGYWEEKGVGNKYTSNFLCSMIGALICALLIIF